MGMFVRYHPFQFPALLPAISMIAFRSGSKAKSTLSAAWEDELGLSSFMFLCRDPETWSTSGQPSWGPWSRSTSMHAITCSHWLNSSESSQSAMCSTSTLHIG